MDVDVDASRGGTEVQAERLLPPLIVAFGPGQDTMGAELVAEILAGPTGADRGIADPGGGVDPGAATLAAQASVI